jgi:autotransporter passenger strand-loop-strand repeat protein
LGETFFTTIGPGGEELVSGGFAMASTVSSGGEQHDGLERRRANRLLWRGEQAVLREGDFIVLGKVGEDKAIVQSTKSPQPILCWAKNESLTLSQPDTEIIVERLNKAVKRAKLRYKY